MITPCLLGAATLLLPDGTPASGARATSLAKEHFVHVVGSEFARPKETFAVATDGTLEVPPEAAGRWIILHAEGWADTTLSPETTEVQLEPWHELSGHVATPHEPGHQVSYHRTERPQCSKDRGSVFWTCTAPIQLDGSFQLRQVPKGHGSVGILREVKTERRIQRWRDFVRFVDVPSAGPTILAGGVEVSGRIVADDLPALITLASPGPQPGGHGLTDAEGRFTIPGVLPGRYRLSARPDLGQATVDIPQRDIEVGTEPLDLGDISGTDANVEIDRRVEVFAGLIDLIRAEAARRGNFPIEKIWIGELTHPLGNYGARVSFAPEPNAADPTRAIKKSLIVHIPGEHIRKYYPEHDSLGYGFRFARGEIEAGKLVENEVRVYPIGNQTLFIPLEPEVDYETCLRLLRDIARGAVETPKSKSERTSEGWRRVTIGLAASVSPDIFPNITRIRNREGLIEIETRNRPFGGRNYQFKETGEGFILAGVCSWVS